MGNTKQQVDEYVTAIGRLDSRRAAGEIDPIRWEIQRAKLLAEATRPKRPADVNFLIIMGCIVGLLAIFYVIIQFLVTLSR
ncbi:hypothetical protein [Microlunatus sp. GCM10028923]|uniref:hypothetical protein n=1 Tax=Microlunatus sp. GCM10028923 TaxID=3273400 RepID=UPI003610AEBD